MVVCPLCGLSQEPAAVCHQCGRSLTELAQENTWELPPTTRPTREDADNVVIARCAQCGCKGIRGQLCKNCGVRLPPAE